MSVCGGGGCVEGGEKFSASHPPILISSSALHLNPVLAPRSVHSQTTFATFKSNSDGTLTVAVIKQKIQVQVSHPLSPCAKSPPGDRAASAAVSLVSCEEGRRALHALSSPAATFLNCVGMRVRTSIFVCACAYASPPPPLTRPARKAASGGGASNRASCARAQCAAQSALTCELHEINGRVTCIQPCTVCA